MSELEKATTQNEMPEKPESLTGLASRLWDEWGPNILTMAKSPANPEFFAQCCQKWADLYEDKDTDMKMSENESVTGDLLIRFIQSDSLQKMHDAWISSTETELSKSELDKVLDWWADKLDND